MIDLNFFFKIFYISINLISGFFHVILTPIIIYLLAKYFDTNFCGDLIAFYIANGIFIIPVMLLHCLSTFLIMCDITDLFGRGSFISLISTPFYIMNIGMGTYFKFIKQASSECIKESYDVNHLLGFTFNFIYFFSLIIFILGILLFGLRLYISKHLIPKYKNTIYYTEHQKLLEEEKLKELEEKKKNEEYREIAINRNSMDPFQKLNMNKADIVNIEN